MQHKLHRNNGIAQPSLASGSSVRHLHHNLFVDFDSSHVCLGGQVLIVGMQQHRCVVDRRESNGRNAKLYERSNRITYSGLFSPCSSSITNSIVYSSPLARNDCPFHPGIHDLPSSAFCEPQTYNSRMVKHAALYGSMIYVLSAVVVPRLVLTIRRATF